MFTNVAPIDPTQKYSPADLPPDGHLMIRERLYRAARRDGLGQEAAEEAASLFYCHWLGRRYGLLSIARGDHARAFYSVRAYARRSNWHGFTGQRRQARGKRVPRGSDGLPVKMTVQAMGAGEVAARERARERNQHTPASVAEGMEHIARSPRDGRKALRLAQRLGLDGVRGLVLAAIGTAAE